MSSPPIAAALPRAAFIAELRSAWRTSQFWIVVARQSIPVIGVIFLDWPALEIGVYFVVQSWLMLSLYCATDLTFNPKYGGGSRDPGGSVGPLLRQFLGAAVLIGIIVGLFGGVLLFSVFPGDEWTQFFDSGWRQRPFVLGLLSLIVTCILEAAHFARRIAKRTPAEIDADDARIASTFYRIVLLFMASIAVGLAGSWAAPVFVIALGLVLIYFEALPRNAALLLGMTKNQASQAQD